MSFKKIIDFYSNGKHAAKSMFMIGFINANHTKNYEEAKIYYTLFIEKYPKHELKNHAEFELKNLGKDINDLPIFSAIKAESTQTTTVTE